MAVAWAVARFVSLGDAPHGFFMDESRSALHALCLAETGRNADGESWPLFSSAFGGGHHPFTLVAFNAAWTRLFGSSPAAFRGASAFFVSVSTIALWFVARALLRWFKTSETPAPSSHVDRLFPALVVFGALLLPWSFQFSRVAWEGPAAAMYLVLSLAALDRVTVATRTSRQLVWAALTGVLAALAMISYPPLRVATPLVLALLSLWLLRVRALTFSAVAVGAACLSLCMLPVALQTLSGAITERTMGVAIFARSWLDDNRNGVPRAAFFAGTLLDNLLSHFKPSFLFLWGDANRRHSSGLVGEFSPVDAFAMIVALAAVARRFLLGVFSERSLVPLAAETRRLAGFAAFGLVGYACGTLPAALTWDSVPHALRSIAAWPFAAVLSGALLTWLFLHRAWTRPLVLAIAVVYTVVFFSSYSRVYRREPLDTFHRDIVEAVERVRKRDSSASIEPALASVLDRYDDMELRYYAMHYDGVSCAESARVLRKLRAQRSGGPTKKKARKSLEHRR